VHTGRDRSRAPGDPAADNIRAIVELERQSRSHETRSDRLGRRISDFVGTLLFVWVQTAAMIGWMGWNSLAPVPLRFDPYPYGLLTFIVPLEGVFIATFVLIAQNQMSRQTDERDHLHLQVNLLAEQEMTVVLRMLRRISEKLDIPTDSEESTRADQLTLETNVLTIAEKLREELPTADGGECPPAGDSSGQRPVGRS
jgi:uncharacterized membrane protein